MPDRPQGVFFDTNVLLYLASDDGAKAGRVEDLIGGGGTISVQVLNEIANVARRKMRMSWEQTSGFVSQVRHLLAVVPVTLAVHDAGMLLGQRYGLSVYDGFIVAAAAEAGCETLFSEDMHDGLVVEDRLIIRNPFLSV